MLLTRNLRKANRDVELIGVAIKGFRIIKLLGRGGMGDVWVAEQSIIKTHVAIKLLEEQASRDQQQVQRFFNEAIAAARIRHTGIVKIFDVGFHAGRAFMIMELLDGETLATRLRRQGRMCTSDVAEIGRQIASILDATHAEAIVHRDLKPDNIFLVPDSELPSKVRVKILDFGIAKLGTCLTRTGESMGTPGYMAPEQWNHAAEADARTDVYALGCLLFELCCGRPPFVVKSIPVVYAQQMNDVPPRARSLVPEVPPDLDAMLARMLAKAPADRPTIRELGAVLAGHGQAQRVLGMPATMEATTLTRATTLDGASRGPGLRRFLGSGRRIAVLSGLVLPLIAVAVANCSTYLAENPTPVHCAAGMVEIPGGAFLMGSPTGTGEDNEHPQHEVVLSSYCIDKTEVTVRAYEACVRAHECSPLPATRNIPQLGREAKAWAPYCNRDDRPDHPVNCVDWGQAAAYCSWKDAHLPTEAEWEYAARGSDGRLYPWGNSLPAAGLLNACGSECIAMARRELQVQLRPQRAMYSANDQWEATAPVGSFPDGASPFGVLDMAGNVYEWTQDWYAPYPDGTVTDPQGPAIGTLHVTRGGAWFSEHEDEVRSTSRVPDDPDQRRVRLGFRCARRWAAGTPP